MLHCDGYDGKRAKRSWGRGMENAGPGVREQLACFKNSIYSLQVRPQIGGGIAERPEGGKTEGDPGRGNSQSQALICKHLRVRFGEKQDCCGRSAKGKETRGAVACVRGGGGQLSAVSWATVGTLVFTRSDMGLTELIFSLSKILNVLG